MRMQLESQTEELQQAIENKMTSAEENRNENMRKILDKLQEHVSRKVNYTLEA